MLNKKLNKQKKKKRRLMKIIESKLEKSKNIEIQRLKIKKSNR